MREKEFLALVLLSLTFLGLFFNIFISDSTSNLVILFLAGLWILVIRLYGYGGGVSVGMGLGFLMVCPFLLILEELAVAEKVAIWAFMFLLVGIGQQMLE